MKKITKKRIAPDGIGSELSSFSLEDSRGAKVEFIAYGPDSKPTVLGIRTTGGKEVFLGVVNAQACQVLLKELYG